MNISFDPSHRNTFRRTSRPSCRTARRRRHAPRERSRSSSRLVSGEAPHALRTAAHPPPPRRTFSLSLSNAGVLLVDRAAARRQGLPARERRRQQAVQEAVFHAACVGHLQLDQGRVRGLQGSCAGGPICRLRSLPRPRLQEALQGAHRPLLLLQGWIWQAEGGGCRFGSGVGCLAQQHSHAASSASTSARASPRRS